MSVVEDVKQKTDIVEVIGQYTQLSKSGKTFRGLCPFHSEKHGSFFVYPDQQSWHCFGACGTGGDIFSFIMKKDGVSFGEALRLLAEKSGVAIPQYATASEVREKNSRLYEANQMAAEFYHQLLLNSPDAQRVRDYLAKRGLNAASIVEFKLGYSPNAWDKLQSYMLERGFNAEELLEAGLVVEHEDKAKFDRFRNRLMFPITDKQGHVIGFGARALADGAQPKYLNSPQTPLFDKSSVLYGLGQAKSSIQHEDSVVIVEGYMDVIMAHQYGFKNVVASMGTAITEEHINLLENKAHTKKLIVALDYDEAGVKGSEHALYLEKYLDEEILVATMPPGEDPDEIIKRSTDDWKLLINTAHPLFDYVVERMYTKFDLNTIDGKSNAVEYFASILQETKNRKKSPYSLQKILNRYDFIPRLAATLGLDRKDLERTLSGYLARSNQNDRKTSKTASILSVGSHQVEDYCLTILLKHPELREQHGDLRPEYFDSSENREIYNVILGCDDISQVRAYLDSSLWEHYDRLLGHELLTNKLEAKLADAVLRLREEHLKRLAQNRADTLAVDEGNQLRELFVKKEHLGEQKRRQK